MRYTSSAVVLLLMATGAAAPAEAQPGWGGAWPRGSYPMATGDYRSQSQKDSREGKVDSAVFAAKDAGALLGHGVIAVGAAAGGSAMGAEQATYEAAIVEQMVRAGYDTATRDPAGGQVAEIRVVRDVIEPEQQKRSPVSGEVSMGTSNRGSAVGMAVAVDMTKPLKALLATRMEVRIRDRVSGKPLWEGRAMIATRDGDSHWTDQAIAARLAAALFDHFPRSDGEAGTLTD